MASITGTATENELDQEQQTQPGQNQQGSVIAPSGPGAPTQNTTQQFNQQQQAPRQIGSGRFTNIQSYLGANKQAGQQLGQTLQKGIGQKLGQAQSTAGRQIGEATQQQQQAQNVYGTGYGQYQALGGTQQIQGLTAAPQQEYKDASGNAIPVTQQQQYSFAAPTGDNAAKGILASEYNADIGSRQRAAADLAANQEAFKSFTGLRTGQTQQEQQALIQKQTQEARDSAEAFKAQQAQRVKQLATESGRGGLLSEIVGGKNYGVGQRSLDSAFLQRDPNRALDNLRQNIGSKATDVQRTLADVGSAETRAGEIQTQGQQLASQLGAQTKQNVQDYVSNLESRIDVMEGQRGQKMDWARKQLEEFKAGKPLNEEFLNLMDLKKGTQLFNVPKNLKDVGEILDVEGFTKDLNLQDVANEQDVANYATFAKLAGLAPDEFQLTDASTLRDISQFGTGDERTLTNRTAKAKQDFLKDAMSRVVTGASQWEAGHKNFASQNLLDFLTGGDNRMNEMVMRGNEFTGRNLGNLSQQWDKFDRQYNIGGNMMEQAGIMGWSPGREAGRTFSDTIQTHEGGEGELAANLALDFFNPGTYVGGGAIGEAFDNLGGVAKDFVSNLADTFGMGGGNDDYKGGTYARNRSQGYLDNELSNFLQQAGFYNYMGDKSMEKEQARAKGTWDGNTWYDPKQDLARFGYGSKNLTQAGQYDPNRTVPQDITLSPMEQAIPIKPGVSREEALRQLAATGQLRDEDFLENTPSVT